MKKRITPLISCSPFFYLLIFPIALTMSGYNCNAAKKNNKLKEVNRKTTELKTDIKVSAKTLQLIQDIQNELTEQKISIKDYSPSSSIIESYNILLIKNNCYVSGMIMTPEDFDKSTLINIGVFIGSKSGKVTTVQIPIKNFDTFLNNNRIEYFQISEKVDIK